MCRREGISMSLRFWLVPVAVASLLLMCRQIVKAEPTKSETATEAEISSQATAMLTNKLSSSGFRAALPKMEVKAVIENELARAGSYFTGIAFYLLVDGQADPRFVYGSVGIGESMEEARQIAYGEWTVIFVPTFVHAVTLSIDRIDAGGLHIYASNVVARVIRPLLSLMINAR